ncbi:unnamed protein product [Absidia cylindrospora]
MSGLSVTLLCDTMISTFNLSFFLWIGIKIVILAQHSNFSFVKALCLYLANLSLWCHPLLYDHPTKHPSESWAFDLEWSELTVTMAIRELCSPGLFGDALLMVLYDISQFKSGPLACKLPIDNKAKMATCDDKANLAELLVAAFALYNVDGRQVMEHQDINVLGLATVMFECVDDMPSFVTISLYINEIMLQFSVNATAQCQQDLNGAWDAAYLIQYAIATDNQWLLRASKDRINHIVNVPHTQDLRDMAYADGCAISTNNRGRTYPDIRNSQYWDWILTNFAHHKRLAWCQHHTISPRMCHCWLTHFLIMSPETATQLYDLHAQRSIIVVARNEDEGAHILESRTGTEDAFVRLSSQSEIITNSTHFKDANSIVLAGAIG